LPDARPMIHIDAQRWNSRIGRNQLFTCQASTFGRYEHFALLCGVRDYVE
jgi:hypothetical protein